METPTTITLDLKDLWLSGEARLLVCGQKVCPSQPSSKTMTKEEDKNAGPFNR